MEDPSEATRIPEGKDRGVPRSPLAARPSISHAGTICRDWFGRPGQLEAQEQMNVVGLWKGVFIVGDEDLAGHPKVNQQPCAIVEGTQEKLPVATESDQDALAE